MSYGHGVNEDSTYCWFKPTDSGLNARPDKVHPSPQPHEGKGEERNVISQAILESRTLLSVLARDNDEVIPPMRKKEPEGQSSIPQFRPTDHSCLQYLCNDPVQHVPTNTHTHTYKHVQMDYF